jgi:GTP-binding protein
MFVDKATVLIQAGDGGRGVVSFRHEKYIDKGGPDGGDGGKGGNIVVLASESENTLAEFRYQKEVKAAAGAAGGKRRMHGRNGVDLVVKLPVGTIITTADGRLVADLTESGQRVVIAKGGQGGFGNAHFVSSRRQAPRIAEKGEKGEAFEAQLELKMIADVGLVGLPNAGKSTLLSVVSNARPEIADYPFTTLTPNLGVVDLDKHNSLLFADIPGLIEGAAGGKGLGDEFLRHVERTAILLHLIDAYNDDVAVAYKTIQAELAAYKVDLSKRPQIVALTKVEGLDKDIVKDQLAKLKKVAPKGVELFVLSAQSKQGLPELLRAVQAAVKAERSQKAAADEEPEIPTITLQSVEKAWTVTKEEDTYTVHGRKIERFAARTDFNSEDALQRLRDIMRKMGITHELVRQGIEPGNQVYIANLGHITY